MNRKPATRKARLRPTPQPSHVDQGIAAILRGLRIAKGREFWQQYAGVAAVEPKRDLQPPATVG